MSDKIRPIHLERSGYVYVRQSTLHQVRNHRESQRRQYGLKARAQELGFRQVVVIDDDLGISGTGSRHRPGFARLLAAVCEGLVGAVLAIEASRLARNNRDWHHLIDLCVLTETLVIDHDGVYDPRVMNDRLLLGLKGTMSEFELALLRQRAQEALRQKILRGEVLTQVPVGYARTEDNRVEMMPDRQVQEAIRGVFAKFREMGSARQVLLWYRQERVQLPVDQRKRAGEEVRWGMPVYNRILSILKNPIYAGAFACGRTRTRTLILDGRARKTAGHAVDLKERDVLIPDHHPTYIPWEEYLHNQKQLAENAAMRGAMIRAYTSTANILPEQTLGRGLRRMTPPGNVSEIVTVVEHNAFVSLYQSELAQEGMPIEVVDLDRVPTSTITIYPDTENKDVQRLDLVLPSVSAGYTRTPTLENLSIEDVRAEFRKYAPLPLGGARSEEIDYEGRHLFTNEVIERMKVRLPLLENGMGAVSYYREELERIAGMRGTHGAGLNPRNIHHRGVVRG